MTGKKVGNSEFRCFAAGRSGKSVYLIGPGWCRHRCVTTGRGGLTFAQMRTVVV